MGYCRMGEEDDGESRDLPADERLAYVVRKTGVLSTVSADVIKAEG